MRILSSIFLVLLACKTTDAPPLIEKEKVSEVSESFEKMPEVPHRHEALVEAPKDTEAQISMSGKSVVLTKPIEEITCDSYENLAKIMCVYPRQKIPFPVCETDDAYAIVGLIPYAICGNQGPILDLHMSYAEAQYAPSTIGLMKRAKYFLSKVKDQPSRPLIYVQGLTGKDAQIMMMAIFSEWKMTGVFTDGMKMVIEEQAKKQPSCLFYQTMHDLAQKHFDASLDLAGKGQSNCDFYKGMDQDSRAIDIVFSQSLVVGGMR